jgi:hypothetical protein
MEDGYTLDTHGANGIRWFRGFAIKSWVKGINRPQSSGIPMAAFRCAQCGFVEFYALDEFEPI